MVAELPRVHGTSVCAGEVKRKVAIVGKGLTFDSGGYNIKAGAGSLIELMKFDSESSCASSTLRCPPSLFGVGCACCT